MWVRKAVKKIRTNKGKDILLQLQFEYNNRLKVKILMIFVNCLYLWWCPVQIDYKTAFTPFIVILLQSYVMADILLFIKRKLKSPHRHIL